MHHNPSNLRRAPQSPWPAPCLPRLSAASADADREAYFATRSEHIEPSQGSGAARVAMWPANLLGGSTFASADRRTASDATPVAPRHAADSTR